MTRIIKTQIFIYFLRQEILILNLYQAFHISSIFNFCLYNVINDFHFRGIITKIDRMRLLNAQIQQCYIDHLPEAYGYIANRRKGHMREKINKQVLLSCLYNSRKYKRALSEFYSERLKRLIIASGPLLQN